jgi:DUF1009 family protein
VAGGGDFPFLIIEECRLQGIEVVLAAVKGEARPEIAQQVTKVEWIGAGQLSRLIRFFQVNQVHHALMAGYVKHVRIFGKDLPDLRMLALFARLPKRTADSILGAIADELASEGIQLMDTTSLLPQMVPESGVLTRRKPDKHELKDIDLGRRVAMEIARLDIGQTVVLCDQAVVAVEGMEGTDATIERAAGLTFGKKLTVVKVSKPLQDMRFDVPVIGPATMEILCRCNVSAMAIDAGRSLIFHKRQVLNIANQKKIALIAFTPESAA